MRFDVAVVGAPFLDITFEGLPRLPQVGEELTARALHVAPGGTGMQAIAAARLGLSTALVAPLGHDGATAIVRSILAHEQVHLPVGGEIATGGLPTTALLATPQGVAMATVLAGGEPRARDVTAVGATSVVLSLDRLPLAPHEARVYAVTGGLELEHIDEPALERLASARALILNAAEAGALTGRDDPEDAALALGRRVPIAVVTLGAEGAIAARNRSLTRTEAPRVEVVDATGAGDLFTAAFVWADLGGAPLQDCLAWASLYAGLSVGAPTALAGALRLDALLNEGAARGLVPPPRLNSR